MYASERLSAAQTSWVQLLDDADISQFLPLSEADFAAGVSLNHDLRAVNLHLTFCSLFSLARLPAGNSPKTGITQLPLQSPATTHFAVQLAHQSRQPPLSGQGFQHPLPEQVRRRLAIEHRPGGPEVDKRLPGVGRIDRAVQGILAQGV